MTADPWEPEDLLRHVCRVCEKHGITYLVVGSTATIAYGEPRFTNDIDIVVELSESQIDSFCTSFPAPKFYLSQPAVLQAVRRRAQFIVIHPSSGLKIDFIILSDSEFDQSRRHRRRALSVLPAQQVWFASPEDVILKKMVYFKKGSSDKHLRDIAGVLRIQKHKLDREYVEKWAARLNVQEIWMQIVAAELDSGDEP